MNFGRSGCARLSSAISLADGADIIALQEIDLNVSSRSSLIKTCKAAGYRVHLSNLDESAGFHRVALLSRLPSTAVCIESTRAVLALASAYGHPQDAVAAEALVDCVIEGCIGCGFPWLALGDWKLTPAELSTVWASGIHCLDDDFSEPLPATCTRRIGLRVWTKHACGQVQGRPVGLQTH